MKSAYERGSRERRLSERDNLMNFDDIESVGERTKKAALYFHFQRDEIVIKAIEYSISTHNNNNDNKLYGNSERRSLLLLLLWKKLCLALNRLTSALYDKFSCLHHKRNSILFYIIKRTIESYSFSC
jgi:demethoxyubiquinone hydroxylase (CLK1/Coq7/Cat5 family)